jgi:hypothetical protein
MTIFDLFSKRAARQAKAGTPDVYQYEELPNPFRVQVVHIWKRSLGDFSPRGTSYDAPNLWHFIENSVAEEHGLFRLGHGDDDQERTAKYFLDLDDVGRALDVIELVFRVIDKVVRPDAEYAKLNYSLQHPDKAIEELNQRFREHSIGFAYGAGEVIRVDSQFIHAEAVKPALQLLSEPGFEGPQEEFLKGHGHHRQGKQKEAINEALKALESTLKGICKKRGWAYNKDKDTAKALLDLVFSNGLVPPFLQSSFASLRALLESSIPTSRNRTSGHGQGATPVAVPDHLAAYVLHMTASSIVFLIECDKAIK